MSKRSDAVIIPAIHDWHLERVLRGLGVWDLIQSHDARCSICGRTLTFENLEAIRRVSGGRVEFICDLPECMSSAPSQTRSGRQQ